MNFKHQIENFLAHRLEDTEYFVVDFEIKGTEKFPKLYLYLDSDGGISIDECASFIREINKFIEENNIISTPYGLDVSSPGLDRPLKTVRQFRNNIGRKLRISLKDETKREGKLISVSETSIVLESKKSKIVSQETIDIENIKEAKVLVTF